MEEEIARARQMEALKRGVLSQDGLYELLHSAAHSQFRLIERFANQIK